MVEEPTGWLKPPKTKADLERQIAELRAENLRLQNEFDNADEMLQAIRADKARLSEALTDVLDRFVAAFPASANYEPIIRARAALSGSGAGGWRTMESAPPACHVLASYWSNEAAEWVYSIELSPPKAPFTRWMPLPAAPTGEAS